ncbi:response regulator [Paenibacillus sp. NFR01]|uniref:response regulator n=1 Tax=Paenibacillus sp. NFR01 TaxID=1566279 RepID=UPI0008B8AF15|nr:response regulator [Paenibacillus sp. NFR01]SEU18024.1 two-component system, response regulator YesN [Paenibacillus sp. NFR01]
MFKVLIVEDERWEREGLVEFLDWPALGVDTVDTAFDGIDGLEKAVRLRPDIIVTDIQMPGMNGLDMAKRVREELPQVHIVILTGYDDFEYAREAIRFHAAEYLLKPVEEEEMLTVMRRVVRACEEERRLQLEEAEKLDLLEAGRKAFLRHALSDLLAGRAEGLEQAADVGAHLSGYGERLPAGYAVWILRSPLDGGIDALEGRAETALDRPVLAQAIGGGVHADFALLFALEAEEAQRQAELAPLLLRELAEAYAAEHPGEPSGGEGRWILVRDAGMAALEQAPAAYAQALRSLKAAVWSGLSGIVAAGAEEEARQRFVRDAEALGRGVRELEKAVRASFGSGREAEALDAIDEIFARLAEYPGAGPAYVGGLLSGLIEHLETLAAPAHPGAAEKGASSLEALLDCESRADMKRYVLAVIRSIAARLHEKRENKEEYVVDRVIRLVEERYGNPELSLAYLAAEVFVSPNHLGMLFKKNTGKTPIEFIQSHRLSRAEELLRTTKQRVSVIAEKVGIPNTSYFGTLFKQAYGMSPGEYQTLSQR